MPAPNPLRPLIDIGDAFNQLAPHNVLALLSKGGITPALARQPTLYEEMQIVRQKPPRSNGNSSTPQDASLPASSVEKAVGPFNVFDEFLKVAPHNVMAQLFKGGQAPLGPPTSFDKIPTGMTLKQYSIAQQGVEWLGTDLVALLASEGDSITIKNTDRDFITVSKMEDEIVEGERTSGKLLGLTWHSADAPGGAGIEDPLKRETRTLKRGEAISYTERKGLYEKEVASTLFTTTKIKYRQRTIVSLTPPIGLSDAEKKALTPEDLTSLRNLRLGEIDGWITDAQSKITTMDYTDIPAAAKSISDINSYKSGLSDANTSGQLPAFPLALGSFLMGGALLPLPPIESLFKGGQAGAASSNVSTLSSIASQAAGLKSQIDIDAQNARSASSKLSGYRSAVASATTKADIEFNYGQAKTEHNNVVTYTTSVHNKATSTSTGLPSYEADAKSEYTDGIAMISGAATYSQQQAAATAAAAKAEAEQAAQEAEERAKRIAEEAKASSESEKARQKQIANSLAQQGRSLVAQGRFSEAATKFNQAAQAYDKAGDSSNASMARQLSSDATSKQSATEAAESAREIAQQKEWDLSSQANRLAQSGDNEGAAKIYDQLYQTTGNSVYKTFADNQRKFGAQSKAKAESKAKGEEAIKAAYEYRRKLAEAKRRKSSA